MKQISELKESPLFNLSLASKELFHSNFIKWFGDSYGASLMGALSNLISDLPKIHLKQINREDKNIDLWLKGLCQDNSTYDILIENKVKSIPTPQQLLGYSKKIKADKYILLTFASMPELPDGWIQIQYDDFLKALRGQIKNVSNSYHHSLVVDYIAFTQSLFEVMKASEGSKLYFPENSRTLKELRIHDLLGKSIAHEIANKLHNHYPEATFSKFSAGKIGIEHSFMRGTPLVTLSYTFKNDKTGFNRGDTVGIQIHGNSFRLFVFARLKDSSDQRASHFIKYIYTTVWSNYTATLTSPTRKRSKCYNLEYFQYEEKANGDLIGIFLYQQSQLPEDITKSDLIRKIRTPFEELLANRDNLQNKINNGDFD